ncbi:B12 binding protein [Terracoccus luteus]|uniref:B12 binding protein n=1 Tax=Terracoccus luteus TaxID=53356 RepID=A0A495Y383_9MICO|nr:MerR family transcriptional regulator [Terracoccus luteus]RKT79894.1 B12 binding protein [Terracoccus luteus]
MYTIKRAAELTGISVATLRAWERRYGVVAPVRSDGGYRLYGPQDVRALAIMNSLVNEGWSAKEAAKETLDRLSRDSFTTDGPWEPGLPPALPGSHLTLMPPPEGAEALVEAARRLDGSAAAQVLDARFALGSFESVVDDWLMPALGRVGEAWAQGTVTVAGEHLVSYAVQRRLAAAYEAAANLPGGPVVVIGLAPGVHHELGLLAFAVAARRAGFSTVYVGADLPADDWVEIVRARSAVADVMAVPRDIDVEPTRAIVERLRASTPGLVVGMGGRQQGAIPGCVHLGHGIGQGVGELARRLRIPA